MKKKFTFTPVLCVIKSCQVRRIAPSSEGLCKEAALDLRLDDIEKGSSSQRCKLLFSY